MFFDYTRIPPHMYEALARYIEHGYQPGNFLLAVLTNDLKEAVARADDVNVELIPTYVAWLYNHAPYGCWGDPARVEAWMTERQAVPS